MNPKSPRSYSLSLSASAALCLFTGLIHAQQTGPAAAPSSAPNKTPTAGDVAAAATEEKIELSPFVVVGEKDNGYQVGNTLAGTRLRTDLRDVGAAVSVINAQFMADTASTNAKDILIYSTSAEAAGSGGNYSGVQLAAAGFADVSAVLQSPHESTRIRGLSGAELTRDFFPTNIPLDSYNTERVDISRGANAILFGLGSPARIINNQLKMPNLRRSGYSLQQMVARFAAPPVRQARRSSNSPSRRSARFSFPPNPSLMCAPSAFSATTRRARRSTASSKALACAPSRRPTPAASSSRRPHLFRSTRPALPFHQHP